MDAELEAVVAHGMVNGLTVIGGLAATLRNRWDVLEPALRDQLLHTVETQVGQVLDTVDLIPPAAASKVAAHLSAAAEAATALSAPGAGGKLGVATATGGALTGTQRSALFDTIEQRARSSATLLLELVRGLPTDVQEFLDALVPPAPPAP